MGNSGSHYFSAMTDYQILEYTKRTLYNMVLKFSPDVVWPVLIWYSKIGDGVFKCSLYLSTNIIDDSPVYSSSQSILSHLNQEITLLFFVMLSLSFGDTSKFFRVFPPSSFHPRIENK